MSKASPSHYERIEVANAMLDAAEDRIAELKRELDETWAKLEAATSELTELKAIHRRCDYDPRFDG